MRNKLLVLSAAVCFFLCFATSYDIQEVRINSSDLFKERSKVHKILSNKPLYIITEGSTYKFLSCATKNGRQYLLPGNHTLVQLKNGTSILKTPGLTGTAKVTFTCIVKRLDEVCKKVKINIESVFRILSAVGRVPLRFFLRGTPEYEGITEYVCKEGQVVDLTCSKGLNYGRLKLKYYDRNGTKLVETDEVGSKDPLNFRLLARAENHQSYVDCIHIDDDRHNGTEFTYRVIFIIEDKNRDNSNFSIAINGTKLTPLETTYAYEIMIYWYYYTFIYSDTLNITFENNNQNTVSNVLTIFIDRERLTSVDFKQTLQKLLKTKYLDRTTMLFDFKNINDTKSYKARIEFDKDDRDAPVILGLKQSNVLYQYNKSATEWLIHYQYMVSEVLTLSCVFNETSYLHIHAQWIYGENIVVPVVSNEAYGTSYINYDFHTNTENKEIICETRSEAYGTRRTTIVLHKIPDSSSLETKTEIVPEKQSKTFQLIGISVGLIMAVMYAFCCWRLKKRAQAYKKKKLARNSCGDANRIDDFTDQAEIPEYAVIEYSDTTHSDTLNVNQGSSTPIRAPAPPPRSTLPAKNTCLQLPPRGCNGHRGTNNKSGLECTHNENEYDYVYGVKKICPCVENEYDYVYGVKKKCACVAKSNRGLRTARVRVPAQE